MKRGRGYADSGKMENWTGAGQIERKICIWVWDWNTEASGSPSAGLSNLGAYKGWDWRWGKVLGISGKIGKNGKIWYFRGKISELEKTGKTGAGSRLQPARQSSIFHEFFVNKL